MTETGAVEAAGAQGERGFRPLYGLTLSLAMSYGMVFSLIAEFRDRFGFSEAETGMIVGAGFLAGFVAQVAISPLADRGYSKVLLRIGATSAFAAMVWMALADSLTEFVVARLFLGVGAGAVAPTARRIVMTKTTGTRGEALGTLAAYDLVGFVMGPLMAALLLAIGGFRWPFVGMAMVIAVAAMGAFAVDADVGVSQSPRRARRQLLGSRRFRRSLGIAFAFYTTIGTFEATWALLYDDLGAEQWLTSLTLSMFVIPMALLARTGGRLAEERSPYRVTAVTIPIAMACMIGYGVIGLSGARDRDLLVWAIVATTLLAMVHSIADAGTMPSVQLAVAKASPEELLATGQGLLSAFGLLVALGATVLASALYDVSGTLAAFGAPTGLMLLGLVYSQRADDEPPHETADASVRREV